MIRIGRAINGISLNGKEYLQNDKKEELHFETEEKAKDFLIKVGGVKEEDLDNFEYEEFAILTENDELKCPFCNASYDETETYPNLDEDEKYLGTEENWCLVCGKMYKTKGLVCNREDSPNRIY